VLFKVCAGIQAVNLRDVLSSNPVNKCILGVWHAGLANVSRKADVKFVQKTQKTQKIYLPGVHHVIHNSLDFACCLTYPARAYCVFCAGGRWCMCFTGVLCSYSSCAETSACVEIDYVYHHKVNICTSSSSNLIRHPAYGDAFIWASHYAQH